MGARKKVNGSKSFPWKAVFGAISIIGVLVLLMTPKNPNIINGDSFSATSQKGLSGFSLKK